MTYSSLIDPKRTSGPIHGIGFVDAFVRFWRLGFTFSGRASLSEYWWAMLGYSLALLVAWLLSSVMLGIPLVLYALASMLPCLAVGVRRLHDTNRSGVMVLLGLIPFGGIVLLVFTLAASDPAGARFDAPAQPGALAPPSQRLHAPSAPSAPVLPPPPPPLRAVAAPVPPVSVPPRVPPTPLVSVPSSSVPPTSRAAVPPAPAFLPPVAAFEPSVTATPAPAPASPVIALPPAGVISDDLDSTRISAPLVAAEWVIALPDGRTIPLASAVLFGRSPSNDGESVDAVLVPIDDPAKSMSKTHARVARDGDTVTVTDLHSTNGTKVVIDQVATSLAPGSAWPVGAAATVLLGSYAVELRRR